MDDKYFKKQTFFDGLRVLMIFFLLLLLSLGASSSPAIVGYLPEWRYEGFNYALNARTGLTHLIFFSLECGSDGSLQAMDRFPSNPILLDARTAMHAHGGKVMICFGGNGRSAGFPGMTHDAASRAKFVANVADLVRRKKLDGVDINWEYPGFRFGRGYLPEDEIKADYEGLLHLMKGLKEAMPDKVLSLAYYPDGRQEQLLRPILKHVDLAHSMSYDAHGAEHSSFELAERTISNWKHAGLDLHKLCLGVPFYGRSPSGWKSYEDLIQQPDAAYNFNDVPMIERKGRLARQETLGGVMIWEAGQDCRGEAVTRNGRTHVVTCPKPTDSLLLALVKGLKGEGHDEL